MKEMASKPTEVPAVSERCPRCRMKLSDHSTAIIDRRVRHHICPIVRGSVGKASQHREEETP